MAWILLIAFLLYLPSLLERLFPTDPLVVKIYSLDSLAMPLPMNTAQDSLVRASFNAGGEIHAEKKKAKTNRKTAPLTQDPSGRKKATKLEPPLNSVNPNSATEKEFLAIGLPKQVARNIVLYRDKGGVFRQREDLKKIYGFEKLEPDVLQYFNIGEQKKESKGLLVQQNMVEIDINTAIADDWKRINGIGPVLSKRIVAYRNLLGGFYKKNQINETWGISDSLYNTFKDQLLDSSIYKKLDINNAEKKVLARHPYLDFKQAALIVKYRKHNPALTRPDDLREMKFLSDSTINKLAPYIVYLEYKTLQ